MPAWAAFDTDTALYPRPPPLRHPPALIQLDQESSCNCASGRTFYNPLLPVMEIECEIYTILGIVRAKVEVQECPTCPGVQRQTIGPDPRAIGLFNWNNKKMMTHELLNDYTSTFTTSETPMVSFATVMSRRYAEAGDSFLLDKMFRTVYFAYATLYDFGDDMRCDLCGPTPADVIWDGVTLAFGKAHLSGGLVPPTELHEESVVRRTVYKPRQQFILDATLRKELRLAMHPPRRPKAANLAVDATDAVRKAADVARAASLQAVLDHTERVKNVTARLGALGVGIMSLFAKVYGYGAWSLQIEPPAPYRKLLVQVSNWRVGMNSLAYLPAAIARRGRVSPSNGDTFCARGAKDVRWCA